MFKKCYWCNSERLIIKKGIKEKVCVDCGMIQIAKCFVDNRIPHSALTKYCVG